MSTEIAPQEKSIQEQQVQQNHELLAIKFDNEAVDARNTARVSAIAALLATLVLAVKISKNDGFGDRLFRLPSNPDETLAFV